MTLDVLLFLSKFLFLALIYLFLFYMLSVIRNPRDKRKNPEDLFFLKVLSSAHMLQDNTPGKLLLEKELRIGRSAECDFIINDAMVSSVHCRLRKNGGIITAEDLQSKNGTFVNREKIETIKTVADGDILQIGAVTFQLFSERRQEK